MKIVNQRHKYKAVSDENLITCEDVYTSIEAGYLSAKKETSNKLSNNVTSEVSSKIITKKLKKL